MQDLKRNHSIHEHFAFYEDNLTGKGMFLSWRTGLILITPLLWANYILWLLPTYASTVKKSTVTTA
jgi:hypothetical protein